MKVEISGQVVEAGAVGVVSSAGGLGALEGTLASTAEISVEMAEAEEVDMVGSVEASVGGAASVSALVAVSAAVGVGTGTERGGAAEGMGAAHTVAVSGRAAFFFSLFSFLNSLGEGSRRGLGAAGVVSVMGEGVERLALTMLSEVAALA